MEYQSRGDEVVNFIHEFYIPSRTSIRSPGVFWIVNRLQEWELIDDRWFRVYYPILLQANPRDQLSDRHTTSNFQGI